MAAGTVPDLVHHPVGFPISSLEWAYRLCQRNVRMQLGGEVAGGERWNWQSGMFSGQTEVLFKVVKSCVGTTTN